MTQRRLQRVLIANRGEIACRIIRTLQATSRKAIAVYSEADRDAPHVQRADAAVCIGDSDVAASYLNIERIIAAALDTNADAIHPGYGLLSENADFALACEQAGLTFIGPSAEAIRLMGDKAAARQRMLTAGVACVPGYDGDDQSDTTLTTEADRIGYPIMVKAANGGGGRGMRRVEEPDALADAVTIARAEALSAFGSDRLILERAVDAPRHVEVQVFGDQHGQIVHLGERDCSVQRRHQKIIEEAPSPAVDTALRRAMGEAAVKAAQDIDYVGAGTVEFLLASDGAFYFLEMNTRLQVEHPVTEMITGHDLVALQLHVAEGEPLPFAQDDVTINGHAFEARLYAEDPAKDFLPQTGRVLDWQPSGANRTDSGIETGNTITPHYDPLVAKIVTHGRNREEARLRMIDALERTSLLGVQHNRDFLLASFRHERFAAGDVTTAFIEQHQSDTALAPGSSVYALAAVCWYRLSWQRLGGSHPELTDWSSTKPLPVPCPLAMETQAQVIPAGSDTYVVRRGDEQHTVSVRDQHDAALLLDIDGDRIATRALLIDDALWLSCERFSGSLPILVPGTSATEDAASQVRAPMHGKVTSVLVAAGDTVGAGQALLTLEAMKMQHTVAAERDGVIAQVHCNEGEQVRGDVVLIELETEDNDARG